MHRATGATDSQRAARIKRKPAVDDFRREAKYEPGMGWSGVGRKVEFGADRAALAETQIVGKPNRIAGANRDPSAAIGESDGIDCGQGERPSIRRGKVCDGVEVGEHDRRVRGELSWHGNDSTINTNSQRIVAAYGRHPKADDWRVRTGVGSHPIASIGRRRCADASESEQSKGNYRRTSNLTVHRNSLVIERVSQLANDRNRSVRCSRAQIAVRLALRAAGRRHAAANPLKLHRPLRHSCGEIERPHDESSGSHGWRRIRSVPFSAGSRSASM